MIDALEYGGIPEEDDIMTSVNTGGIDEEMEVTERLVVNDNDCMMDSAKEEYDEEQYEVWLENEILALDVDGGALGASKIPQLLV